MTAFKKNEDESLPAYDLSRLNVLVVDDNRHMVSLLRQVLSVLGVRSIATASDGRDALSALRQFDADMVITDWVMAPIDGITLLKRLRSGPDSPCPEVPVLMLTAYTDRARVEQARDAGVNEYLAKPISAACLYARLVAMIERPKQFVRAPSYIGPDRRRPTFSGLNRRGPGDSSSYAGPERRAQPYSRPERRSRSGETQPRGQGEETP